MPTIHTRKKLIHPKDPSLSGGAGRIFISAVATKTNGYEEALAYFRISTNVLAAPLGGFTVFNRASHAVPVD